MIRSIILCAILASLIASPTVAQQASEATRAANEAVREQLAFDDERDFEAARQGFIATFDGDAIEGEDGNVVYDFAQFDFLEGDPPDTVNPSLWRQSQLNAMHGLFEVVEGAIYQVRGFDLANVSFIRGETGWIVVDPLTTNETAQAAIALLREHVEDLPVSALILTHSHADHFGGVKGVVSEEELARIEVIAPEGFFVEAVNENVLAGNAMSRRATYMYGNVRGKGPEDSLGSGLGTTTAAGTVSIAKPTITITETPTQLDVDGLEMTFMNVPDAEAPAELMFYIHSFEALMQAEIINRTLHNLYTLRGAKVRNGQLWANYIHDTINRFGDTVEVSFGSHHWPTWGNAEINDFWSKQRDIYRFIHDETLRLANHGLTMLEIANQIELPESLAGEFYNRGYYGTLNHNAKAQYQLYFGWFSGNPSELNELPPTEAGQKFVEYAGGAENVIERAREDYAAGEYRWVATALNHVVFADPDNEEARALLADTLTQLGYQAESGPWRNFYLSGAQELRDGVVAVPASASSSEEIIREMSLATYLDYIGMTLDHPEAARRNPMTLNFSLPDTEETFVIAVTNGVMNYTLDQQAEDADASVTIDRSTLDDINLGVVTLEQTVSDGDVTIEGDAAVLGEFISLLDSFEFFFPIVEPRDAP